jgi:hypothetical protein
LKSGWRRRENEAGKWPGKTVLNAKHLKIPKGKYDRFSKHQEKTWKGFRILARIAA